MTDQQALCPGPGMSSTRVSGKIDRLDRPPANGRTESASTPRTAGSYGGSQFKVSKPQL